MSFNPRHIVALAANAALGVVALTDMTVHGLTGSYSVAADGSGNLPAQLGTDLIHAAAYASLVVVLWKEGGRFRRANRLARILRVCLLAFFGILAVGFATISPLARFLTIPEDSVFGLVWGLMASVGFFGMMLGSALLGFALLRTNPLGLGARVLLGVIPSILLVVLLSFAAPGWAHPALIELVVGVGVALLGVVPARVAVATPEPVAA